MIYVYAITTGRDAPPQLRGLDDAPPALVDADGVQGVYSHHADAASVEATPDTLWAHEAVVDALLRDGSVLPLRFGTTLENVAALHRVLHEDHERFARLLERVAGCVELAVRVGLPERADGADDGRAYLTEKLAARRTADDVLGPLESFAADTRRGTAGAEPVVKASYLVPRDDVVRFADELRGLQSRHPELTLSCTGPWAPYSFVGDDAL